VDPADVAGRLLKKWRAGALFGYGQAFRETLERLDSGVPWEEAASVDKPSNGAVMKIAPVGLWHWQMGEEIREDALAISHLTHRDPRAVAPAVAFAHVVGHLVTHRPLDVEEVIDVAEFSARPIDADTADTIGGLRDLLQMDEDAAYRAMLGVPQQVRGEGNGIPSEAPATLLVALEAFLRAPEEFDRVMRRALSTGGDVDTFAAVAGNLAGVYNGIEGLPEHLLEDLLERDRIERLARALYEKTVDEDGSSEGRL
jgi:ADP-ribosylglycohydrolase